MHRAHRAKQNERIIAICERRKKYCVIKNYFYTSFRSSVCAHISNRHTDRARTSIAQMSRLKANVMLCDFFLLVVVVAAVVISIIENVARDFDFMLILCIESTFTPLGLRSTHRSLMWTLFCRLQSLKYFVSATGWNKSDTDKRQPNEWTWWQIEKTHLASIIVSYLCSVWSDNSSEFDKKKSSTFGSDLSQRKWRWGACAHKRCWKHVSYFITK